MPDSYLNGDTLLGVNLWGLVRFYLSDSALLFFDILINLRKGSLTDSSVGKAFASSNAKRVKIAQVSILPGIFASDTTF